MMDVEEYAENWLAFVTAMSEGRISVILEGVSDSIDGGIIVTDADDVLDHILSAEGI